MQNSFSYIFQIIKNFLSHHLVFLFVYSGSSITFKEFITVIGVCDILTSSLCFLFLFMSVQLPLHRGASSYKVHNATFRFLANFLWMPSDLRHLGGHGDVSAWKNAIICYSSSNICREKHQLFFRCVTTSASSLGISPVCVSFII